MREIEIELEGGELRGGGRIEVGLGEEIRIVVTGDVTDEVHLHGYDLLAALTPMSPAVLELTAAIPGIFELELEGEHLRLAELEVSP